MSDDQRLARLLVEFGAATARAERAEAAIAAVRARCAERQAKDCTYVRIADVLAALDSTDPPEAPND